MKATPRSFLKYGFTCKARELSTVLKILAQNEKALQANAQRTF